MESWLRKSALCACEKGSEGAVGVREAGRRGRQVGCHAAGWCSRPTGPRVPCGLRRLLLTSHE